MTQWVERGWLCGVLAIWGGAVLLVWPALLNGYPIVFSDTNAFLLQAGRPQMFFDKPWIYGPFLLALHGNTTLWLPLAGQGLIVSHVLWLLLRCFGVQGAGRHLAACGVLAVGSAAPWVAGLLMPDIFAPVLVLAMFLLAFDDRLGRWERGWLVGLAAFGIASHLAHLVLAAACIAAIGVLRWRRAGVVALPLGMALLTLAATNVVGFGTLAISPYGAVFSLARMASDGLVDPVLARACPASGWRMCGWAGRFPVTSDGFLWDVKGPMWTTPGGPIGLAPEAAAIVKRVIVEEPLGVLATGVANTLRQVTMVGVGDALVPDSLDTPLAVNARAMFPAEERARFAAGLQARGMLAQWARTLNMPHAILLLAGTLATLGLLAYPRTNVPLRALAALILVGLLANAVSTGALSGPHDRYQARIAWLSLLTPILALLMALRRHPGR